MAGGTCCKQDTVDLGIYQSSYMIDYQPYRGHRYSTTTPEEQAKLDTQLRNKEFYRPSHKMEDEGGACRSPGVAAEDQHFPGFLPPQALEGPPAEEASALHSTHPVVYPVWQAVHLPRGHPSRLQPSPAIPCLLEPTWQPAPEEGTGYLLLPGCPCPLHQGVKVPILTRWGPLMPFYQ
ncbi:protein SPMIP9 [Ctenodactylus gundi]